LMEKLNLQDLEGVIELARLIRLIEA
jgi:hypothetical protein